MDCAIAIFGGKGIVSYLNFLFFTFMITLLVILYASQSESKRKIRELEERIGNSDPGVDA